MALNSRTYLRELAQAITRQEDLTDERARKILYELALRIYWLLLKELPPGRFERLLAWRRLRPQITLLLIAAAEALATILLPAVYDTEIALQAIMAKYLALPALPPRSRDVVFRTTTVTGTPLEQLFTPLQQTGLSPFAAQLLRLLDRTITTAFFSDIATPDIATSVVRVRSRLGKQTPIAARGTVVYAWTDRVRAITAASMWALVTPTVERYTPMAPALVTRWRWHSVLDPRTCPQCRPLNNTTASTPSSFPYGFPPLHPRCRCIVTPEITAT